METGPVECMIVAFPGNKFNGEILPAIAEQVDAGVIRIIDVAFVLKDESGEVAYGEVSDLDPNVEAALRAMNPDISGLLNEDDLAAIAEELDPNSSGALIVWEDLWAAKIGKAIRDSGGVMLDLQRIPATVVEAAREYAAAEVAAAT